MRKVLLLTALTATAFCQTEDQIAAYAEQMVMANKMMDMIVAGKQTLQDANLQLSSYHYGGTGYYTIVEDAVRGKEIVKDETYTEDLPVEGEYRHPQEEKLEQMYQDFIGRHQKHYPGEDKSDYYSRRTTWKEAEMDIWYHKKESQSRPTGYTMAHNFLSDWRSMEKNQLNGHLAHPEGTPELAEEEHEETTHEETWDWRNKIDMNEVKDIQVNQSINICQADWAATCISAFEARSRIEKRKQGSGYFSMQQAVDCIKPGKGCQGMNYTTCMHYFRNNDFIGLEKYFYNGNNDDECKQGDQWLLKEGVRGNVITQVPSNNVIALKSALNVSPVIAAMKGDWKNFQLYSTGILTDDYNKCTSVGADPNHSVLIVGYNKNAAGKEYWIVQNNWGLSWGVKGYAHIEIRYNNEPGICNMLSYMHYPSIRPIEGGQRYEEL